MVRTSISPSLRSSDMLWPLGMIDWSAATATYKMSAQSVTHKLEKGSHSWNSQKKTVLFVSIQASDIEFVEEVEWSVPINTGLLELLQMTIVRWFLPKQSLIPRELKKNSNDSFSVPCGAKHIRKQWLYMCWINQSRQLQCSSYYDWLLFTMDTASCSWLYWWRGNLLRLAIKSHCWDEEMPHENWRALLVHWLVLVFHWHLGRTQANIPIYSRWIQAKSIFGLRFRLSTFP